MTRPRTAAIAWLGVLLFVWGCDGGDPADAGKDGADGGGMKTDQKQGDAKADAKADDGKTGENVTPTPTPRGAGTRVTMKTSLGEIVIDLHEQKAPRTVAHFLKHVDAGQYDGTIFHRVAAGYIAQAGGFNVDLTPRTTEQTLKNEAPNGLSNVRGTVAMALREPNAPDSAKTQFFINLGDNLSFDHSADGDHPLGYYCVFGKVVSGMDVVDRIADLETTDTGRKGLDLVPEPKVVIHSVRRTR